MKRSITGAMFYYHEGAYFTTAKNYRARVKKWEERPLRIENEESVKKKFLREIERVTKTKIKMDGLVFIEPYKIEYEISPLFFYCSNNDCGWNIKFDNVEQLTKYIEKEKNFRCKRCGSSLIQSGHVFACTCGNIQDMDEKYCSGKNKTHTKQKMDFIRPSIYEVYTWKYKCRICGREIWPIIKKCENCGEKMDLKPTEASGLTTPLSFTTPAFETPNYKWIAKYLEIKLSDEEKQFLIKHKDKVDENKYFKNKIEEFLRNDFKEYEYILERLSDYAAINEGIKYPPKTYPDLGIKFYKTDRINLVKGVYAYIVNAIKPSSKTSFNFFIHSGKYNVLANKIENTEGILLEFDRSKIIEWMEENNFLQFLPSKKDLKKWFIEMGMEGSINKKLPNDITNKIITLIHTISHGFIVSMPTISGVSIDSVSELLFPEIPAVLLYTTYTTSIGHLESLFDNMMDEWIAKTKDDTLKNCVHDPICLKEDHACAGCIMISEVVCSKFNEFLDRRYVIGDEDIKGFWE